MPLPVLLNDDMEIKGFTKGEAEGFPVGNLLQVDEEVYCSEGVNGVVVFGTRDGEDVTITNVVVRGPVRGFGEPVRSGVVVPSKKGEPAPAADSFDDLDVEDPDATIPEGVYPFVTNEFMESVLTFDPPIVANTFSVFFLDTHGVGDNVDATMVAFLGSRDQNASLHPLNEAQLRSLNVLRAAPSQTEILPLETVIHHLGRSVLVVAVGEGKREVLEPVVKAGAAAVWVDGWVWCGVDSKEAKLLRRQFGSPEGEFLSVVHQNGQFLMGGDDLGGFLAKCNEMLKEKPCCHDHGHGHGHGQHEHETKPPIPSHHPYLTAQSSIAEFTRPHPLSIVFYTAPWCSASARSLPLLPDLPTALIDTDTYTDPSPENIPSVEIYSNGTLVETFDELTRQGILDVKRLNEVLESVSK